MKSNLSTFNNSWYKPGNKYKILIWHFFSAIFFQNSFFPISFLKVILLRIFGAKVGHNVTIKQSITIKYPWFLEIGNNVWLGENVWIDNLAKISIADNVCISQGAMLLCGNHNYKKKSFDLIVGEIRIEEGVWIGAKTVICPSVICESHSILTVGSIASKNLESFGIYKGNPAIKIGIRKIEQ